METFPLLILILDVESDGAWKPPELFPDILVPSPNEDLPDVDTLLLLPLVLLLAVVFVPVILLLLPAVLSVESVLGTARFASTFRESMMWGSFSRTLYVQMDNHENKCE